MIFDMDMDMDSVLLAPTVQAHTYTIQLGSSLGLAL